MKRLLLCFVLLPCSTLADSLSVDKVYHPYVQPLEREIEVRMVSADGEEFYRLGLGKSLSDKLFVEAYLIGKDDNNHLSLNAYEIEAKWQLTEQGEYAVDWGLMFELERVLHDDTWEISTSLLMEKEWGKWVAAANLSLIAEWGNEINNEFETALALQTRYRYSRYIEPAIEFYSSESGQAIGPVVMGDIRLGNAKKLHWEVGSIFGLGYKGPDNTWRLLMEYEF
tara:strand:+ start:1069 stop:1743 length:675 start_codon:yes stop_codon:yes gene_type:complete